MNLPVRGAITVATSDVGVMSGMHDIGTFYICKNVFFCFLLF